MEDKALPRHIAVIMDGNGRWAAARALPRPAGHRMGVKAVKQTVENCARRGIEVLTLFAFSSENWKRPKDEVSMLMGRFLEALESEVDNLHKNQIRMRFIGNLAQLSSPLRERMKRGETDCKQTAHDAHGSGRLRWALGHPEAAREVGRSVASRRNGDRSKSTRPRSVSNLHSQGFPTPIS